jgi:hypothetical protein
MSRRLKSRSKYEPHQGERECKRRLDQYRRWLFEDDGCKLGPSSLGVVSLGVVYPEEWPKKPETDSVNG